MSKDMYAIDATMTYDGLIAGVNPSAVVAGGTIAKLAEAATYARGTVLAKSTKDGKLYILGTSASLSSESFDGDGSATTFTVTAKPDRIDNVKVGGVAVTVSSYDASTGVVTLAAAPAAGTDNVVVSFPDEEMVADCILADETAIGTSTDVNTPVYVAGCFNVSKLAGAAEYTMTAADKTKLRERGIYLAAVAE